VGTPKVPDAESGSLPRGLEVNLVRRPDQVSAFLQMLMEVGQMEEVLIEAGRHLLHDLFPLSHCRHEIAFPAQGGKELNVVPVFILALKESSVEKNVRAG
jgi:hypothetical protein